MQFFTLPELHSGWGQHVDDLFWLTYYLTGVAFLAVCVILFGCCALYYERPGRRAEYFHGDKKAHLMVTGLLSALVFLGLDFQLESRGRRAVAAYVNGFKVAEKLADEGKALRVQVRGRQFKWYFRWAGPDGRFGTRDDLVNTELHVPQSVPVVVQIQSRDVIHSFYLPYQRLKQDAVPGITTTAWFEANKVGDWEVGCAELCGSGHTQMRNPMIVHTQEDYDKWYAEELRKEAVIDEETGLDAYEDTEDEEDGNWGWDWRSKQMRSKSEGEAE